MALDPGATVRPTISLTPRRAPVCQVDRRHSEPSATQLLTPENVVAVSGVAGSSFRPWLERLVSFPVNNMILPQKPAGVKGGSPPPAPPGIRGPARAYFMRAIFRVPVQPSTESLTK